MEYRTTTISGVLVATAPLTLEQHDGLRFEIAGVIHAILGERILATCEARPLPELPILAHAVIVHQDGGPEREEIPKDPGTPMLPLASTSA